MTNTLSLADLNAFDPTAPKREGERRFLCPLCGMDKPRNAAHRSFCLNSNNGLYHCKRCNSRGCLKEFWRDKLHPSRSQFKEKKAQQLRQSFEIETMPTTPTVESRTVESRTTEAPIGEKQTAKATPVSVSASQEKNEAGAAEWQALWESREACQVGARHHAALDYLARRGISLECARANEVCFVPNWYGKATLGFPFKNTEGEVVAIAGRALRDGGLDKPASGPKKAGAFWAHALGFGALDAALPAIILCEAPFDALSLAMAGYPALALGGINAPTWLHQKCAFRRVLLAFDADDAGDKAALNIGAHLASFGATCLRLPPQGAKDWNELLQKAGTEAIEELVAPIVSGLG